MSIVDPPRPDGQRPLLSIAPSKVSVLVVEDDDALRRALRRDLERDGFRVQVAASAAEALELLNHLRVDVVLTDLVLGDASGFDVIEALQRKSAQSRPILMSGHASGRDHERALALGAVRVLTKPFSREDLTDAIRQAIDCEVGYRGSVHGLSLVDMLQMFHYGRRSVTLHVGGQVAGSIHLRKGELVHARAGDRTGRDALRILLSSASGSVRSASLETNVRSLEGEFDSILLDSLREMDETSHRGSELVALQEVDGWRSDELATIVRQEVPGASAWLVGDAGSEALVDDARDEELVSGGSPCCDLDGVRRVLSGMERLVGDWAAFEVVAVECSVGMLRVRPTSTLVVWMDTSQTRAVQRFRSHFAGLCRRLAREAPRP
jgi:CheY-like chemotaxis protein